VTLDEVRRIVAETTAAYDDPDEDRPDSYVAADGFDAIATLLDHGPAGEQTPGDGGTR